VWGLPSGPKEPESHKNSPWLNWREMRRWYQTSQDKGRSLFTAFWKTSVKESKQMSTTDTCLSSSCMYLVTFWKDKGFFPQSKVRDFQRVQTSSYENAALKKVEDYLAKLKDSFLRRRGHVTLVFSWIRELQNMQKSW